MPLDVDHRAIFDRSPNPYMVLDRELRLVDANAAYLAVTGRRLDELLGRRVDEVFPHDPADPGNASLRALMTSLRRVLETRAVDVLPVIPYRVADGVDRYWSATHTPILDEHGEVRHILQHTVDVTALRDRDGPSPPDRAGVIARAEEVSRRNDALGRRNAWLQAMFAQAPVALCVLEGPAHVVELANERVCEVWGRKPADVMGRPLLEALPEVRGQEVEGLLADVLATGRPFVGRELEVQLARGPGGALEAAWFDFVYQPLAEAGGRPHSVLVVAVDVTVQVLARRRSEAAQAELEAIFASFPEALCVGDREHLLRANAAAARILGYPTPEALLRDPREIVTAARLRHPESGEPVPIEETPYQRALRGESSRLEILLTDPRTGEERWIVSSGAPVRTADGRPRAVVTHLDVTVERRAQREATQLATVLAETRDFVGIADLSGRLTFANRAARELLGVGGVEEIGDRPFPDLFVPEQRASVREHVVPTALRDGFWEGELSLRHQGTGAALPVLYTLLALRDARGRPTAFAMVTRDLRPRKAAEAERQRLLENERRARAQAEQANVLKDHFLATVSHELRTPLTAILGWMRMLRGGLVAAEKREHAIATVERNARVLAQLVEDLLDVSRIISGKLVLELEQADIAAIVTAAVETVRPTAEAKGVALEVELDTTAVVTGDPRRLQQVVWNLLSNAVKFTPAGGRVTLGLERADDHVAITVRDDGVGIDPAFLPHVFERFRQAEGGPARGAGGLGLGLSIVRHVVEAHRGTVAAESAGAGQGATFRVRLPLERGADAVPPSEDEVLAAPPSGLAGLHVLVVDDEQDVRDYVRALLEAAGARVTAVGTAQQALELLPTAGPDVLLSDLAMPGEDGFRLLQRVRSSPDPVAARVPAVALTAYARAEDRTRAMLAGFQNHVPKPIEPRELVAVLASVARR